MRTRCTNPRRRGFSDYGGRGIKVCDRWNSFENFLADMGPKPSPLHSIERVDNDGDYEPGNCVWAEPQRQHNNQRNNRFVEWDGQRLTVAEWSRVIGIPARVLSDRLNKLGWSVEKALTAAYRSAAATRK